ncbi:MAG: tetratricopeptide repeat protein [Victivallales bacterium]
MRIFRLLAVFAFLEASFFLLPYQASAKSDTETAITLSNELNEHKMFDYSELALNQEMAKNPEDIDLLKIQLGVTKFASNKADEGNTIISSVQPSSKYYPNSRRVLGVEAVKKQKFDVAVKAFEDYFKIYLAAPPKTDVGKKEFTEAANYLIYAYKQLNKIPEAEKTVKYLDALESDKEAAAGDDRDTKLRQLQIKLDTVEEMIEKKRDGWQKTVNDSIKPIDDLVWKMDSIAALAYIEKARAYLFLGRIDDALKVLKDQNIDAMLKAFDEAYKEQSMEYISPSVYQSYWLGKTLTAKAEKAPDAEKTALYAEAIQNFYRIVTRFEKFPKYDDALSGFSECKEKLEAVGKKITIPENIKSRLGRRKGGGSSLERKEADQHFADGKFANALEIYIKILKADRKGADADIVLARLAFSYLKTGQTLEAMAAAAYLCDFYPAAENTPTTMVQVGEVLWGKKDYDDAIIVYDFYLKTCPADQFAGDVSARIARFYYNKAAQLATEANKLPQGEEKAKKAEEAREAFRTTAPYYQNIVDNFAHTKWGLSSFYSLAWCYTNAKDYIKGAEKFKTYCEKEMSKNADMDLANLSDAKLRIADNYIQHAGNIDKEAEAMRTKASEISALAAASPAPKDAKKEEITPAQLNAKADELNKQSVGFYKDALQQLLELTGTWRASKGILENTKDPRVLKSLESAQSLIGWAYDGAKDKENACKSFEAFIKKYPASKQVPSSMFRMGIIYGDLNKFDLAGQVLETLANKYPQAPEGRLALSTLARNMYEVKNFEKSIAVFNKILTEKVEVSVQDLRWACANLVNCDSKHPKEGAEVAIKAGEMLLAKIDKPAIEEWLGKQRTRETAGNPVEQQRLMGAVREKIYFDYSTACYWGGQLDKALKTADELLVKENSAYYFEGRFLRAMIYRAMKKYDKALENYGEISITALSAKKHSVYGRSQCMMGETYMEMKDYSKAYGTLSITSSINPDELKDYTVKMTKEEMQEQKNWIEFAVYNSAFCLAKLGKTDELTKMVGKYRAFFPNGKYVKEIGSLPPAETAPVKTDAAEKKPLVPAKK